MKNRTVTNVCPYAQAGAHPTSRPVLQGGHASLRSFCRMMLLIALFALSVTPAMALCRPENNCRDCPDQSERLKCKFDSMAEEGKKTMQLLQDVPGLLTPAQSSGMTKARERLDREKNRLKPEDFKMMAKKKSANCQLVEASGNGDGICDPKAGETCVEVVGDGIGDDDGICWPMTGKKREVCAQICDQEAIVLDEEAMDDDAVAELEGMYDTITGHSKEANEAIPETVQLMHTLRAVGDDPCALQTSQVRNLYDTYKKAKWAATGTRAAADVAERFCDQTWGFWFSFTVGAACIGAETAILGLNSWWDAVDIVEAELDALTLDATLECARTTTEITGQTGSLITEVQGVLTGVSANNNDILRLIQTPPGQRENYPKP